MCLSCKISPDKLYDGAQMTNLWRFLHPTLPASRVQPISDLHSKFALRTHHVWKYMVDIQSATAEIRRGKKKKERKKKKPQDENIMSASATQGGHNNILICHIIMLL